jgi:hypothetical protein
VLHPSIPKRCEIVRYAVYGIGGTNFPVAGERWLRVGNMKEVIWLQGSISIST